MPRKPQTPSLADEIAARDGVAAVDRALSLLAVFRPGDEALTLAALAERTRLYKSTVLRLLASLVNMRFVQRLDDGRYALGPEIARLHGIYASSFSVERVVMPVLRDLVDITQESAAYHVIQGDMRLCQYRVNSPLAVRDHTRAGDLLPLRTGAGGRILTAFSGIPADAGAADRRLLARIKRVGHYAAIGDRDPEIAGISAPVFHADGRIAAALTLTMPAHRFDMGYVQPVAEAARKLSGLV